MFRFPFKFINLEYTLQFVSNGFRPVKPESMVACSLFLVARCVSVREQMYSQTFDELSRQVAINCSERGLLLLRVCDLHKYFYVPNSLREQRQVITMKKLLF